MHFGYRSKKMVGADGLPTAMPRVMALTETFKIADFTDNTDATGYKDFAGKVPAGALVIGWRAKVATGFTGNSSATVMVGVSGDTDRFSAPSTKPSCYAAATVGALNIAADGHQNMGAAFSPRVTVTGGSDFSNITAGEMVVSVLYVDTL